MALKSVTTKEFARLKAGDSKYYKNRWPYLSMAAKLAAALKPETALELGPYMIPVLVGSDVMDVRDNVPASQNRVKLKWDATKTPWPVEDKAYDVFVALQVWEHLGDAQAEAFKEVRRIAKTAVLSFPFRWKLKDTSNCHHMVDSNTIKRWTLGTEPTKRVIIDEPDPRYRRAIYVFDFR